MKFKLNGKSYRMQFTYASVEETPRWKEFFQRRGFAPVAELCSALGAARVKPPKQSITYTGLRVFELGATVPVFSVVARCSPLDTHTREAGRQAAIQKLCDHLGPGEMAGAVKGAYFGRRRRRTEAPAQVQPLAGKES